MTVKIMRWLKRGLLLPDVRAGDPLRVIRGLLAVLTIGSLIVSSQAGASGVAFQTGDVLASVGGGMIRHYSATGTLLDTLDSTTNSFENTGMCFDAAGNLYATQFTADTVSKFDSSGNLLNANFGSGYNSNPESCVFDSANHIYIGQAGGSVNVLEFDTSGSALGAFAPAIERRGTDWIDLAADQCTLHYTSEGSLINRFDVCTNTQLPAFAFGLPGPCYAHRILADGEELVACASEVVRLDSTGTVLQTYPASNYSSSSFFAMNIDPDGQTFWTADQLSGLITRINIATGASVTSFSAALLTDLSGITIVGELTVATTTTTTSTTSTTTSVTTTTSTTTTTTTSVTTTTLPGCTASSCVPGSGPNLTKSDCYVELDVQGITDSDVRSGRVVLCHDGDPCDTDGAINDVCTFKVAVCIDQPNLSACHPPTQLQALHVSTKLPAAAVPSSLTGSACGSFVDVPVKLHRGAHNGKKTGKLVVPANATAGTGTTPRGDRDTYVLECLPGAP
jgi:sugar lactone lactonase YvrE